MTRDRDLPIDSAPWAGWFAPSVTVVAPIAEGHAIDADADEVSRAWAVATGVTIPEPRPELLVRVLDGLRGLPSGPMPEPWHAFGQSPASPSPDAPASPLPRRHG